SGSQSIGHVERGGECVNYVYQDFDTSVSTNPIGLLFGFYGVSVTHAVSPNIAIRADVNVLDFDYQSGYEVGASVPIYFKRVFHGPFLEAGIISREVHDKHDPSTASSCFACEATSVSLFG